MATVGSLLVRTSARALAALLAALSLCSGALAAIPPVPLMTYITALDKPAPQVWVSTVGGGSPIDLGPASSALISPDGTQVAAISSEGQAVKSWTLSLYATTGVAAAT